MLVYWWGREAAFDETKDHKYKEYQNRYINKGTDYLFLIEFFIQGIKWNFKKVYYLLPHFHHSFTMYQNKISLSGLVGP